MKPQANPSVSRRSATPWQNFRRDISSSLIMIHVTFAAIPILVMPDLYTRPIAILFGESVSISDFSIDSYVTRKGRRADYLRAQVVDGRAAGEYIDFPLDLATFVSRGLTPATLDRIPAHVIPGWPAFSCLKDDFGLFDYHAKILLAFYFGLWAIALPISYFRHVWLPTHRGA